MIKKMDKTYLELIADALSITLIASVSTISQLSVAIWNQLNVNKVFKDMVVRGQLFDDVVASINIHCFVVDTNLDFGWSSCSIGADTVCFLKI